MGSRLLALVIIAVFWFSCRELTDEKYISEGVIEYAITYPETEENSLFSGLFPDKMVMYFKDGKTAYTMTGGMGLFKTTIIANPDNNEVIQMVKVMNKKIAFIYDSMAMEQIDKEFPVKEIRFDDHFRQIAGYNSQQAVITMANNYPEFNVFFTKDINLLNANWATPFRSIDGVLLEYRLRQYNIDMKFSATSVLKESVEDSLFTLPADYKLVPKEELDQIFLGFN